MIDPTEQEMLHDADAAQDEPDEQLEARPEQHVDTRGVVFPELKILYVPVPKAGCTAVLWALAQLAGLEEDRFYGSFGREVSRSLTIHDLKVWPKEFLFGRLPQEQKDEILASDDWLRFTVVRHPFRRLWSAWQSKILLYEPQFIEKFADEAWFPHSVDSADGVLKSFRRFLEALERDPTLVRADVHWAPQVPLTSFGDIPYDHVGRVEKLAETVEHLREHVHSVNGKTLPEMRRANVTPLPYIDELFDESDARILGDVFADDMKQFEYEPPSPKALAAECPQSWIDAVDAVTPALEELRYRNERVGDLQVLFKNKREELNGRLTYFRKRNRAMGNRIRRQTERIGNEERLREEEQRRNERLQKRLRQATTRVKRMENSASWRYTAPLRRLTRLKRKATGRQRGD